MHGESVNPDDDAAMDSYIGLRDAYSRIGVKASLPISDDITTYGQLELPIDSVNLAVQDPWDQNADIRIGKVGVKGQFGDLAYGQMWMPYYNAIAYPVDMFSTYYSGFATYTTFRKGDTVSYYSPTFYGLSAAAAYSEDNGVDDDDRFQATLSYNIGDLTLSAGLDDLRGEDDLKIWGGSLMWQVTDALYVGAKYEQHDSKIDSGYGADGD
ncbi:porin, partial [Thiorhodococcus minor]|nr:porin [Thiorhodococcus minor]